MKRLSETTEPATEPSLEQLSRPVIDLYVQNGRTIQGDLDRALDGLERSEELLADRDRRIADVFQGRKSGPLPMWADTKWWIVEQYHDGTLEDALKDIDVPRVIAASRIPKSIVPPSDPEPVPGVTREESWSGPPVRYAYGGYPGTTRTVRVSTSVGSLVATETYASRSFGVVEYPIKTRKDLDVARHIYELIETHAPKTFKGGGFSAPLTPLQLILTRLAGVENGIFLLYDEREAVSDFMGFLDEIHLPVVEYLTGRNGRVFSVENLAADVSAPFFDEYLGPQLARRSEICRNHGAVYGIHHDGCLQPLFSRLQEAGVEYVNGVTAAPSGDVEPERLRELAGNRMVIHDILPQAIFLPDYDREEFEAYLDRVFRFYRDDPRIIFGIGDMLPCNGSIERFEYACRRLEEITG
jgi:hypothetical protein